MGKKIKDNVSIAELDEQLKGMEAISSILKPFGLSTGVDIDEVKEQFDNIKNLPDNFNKTFSERGWICHESMDIEIMKLVLKTVEENSIEEGEEILVKYYEKHVPEIIERYSWKPIYKDRAQLLKLAVVDYKEGRYYASILVFLSQLDGIINDVKNTGLFASNTDLDVWDSISGSSEGLSKISSIFNQSRKKTNNEPLSLPVRNGILHGRDINYSNKLVATKCLALFVYIDDWINVSSNADGRKEEYDKKRDIPLEESLQKLRMIKQRIQKSKELLKKWQPREKVNLGNICENTPEYNADIFFKYIQKKNYGSPVALYNKNIYGEVVTNEKASCLRKDFKGIKVLSWKIIDVVDSAAAISIVTIDVDYELEGANKQKEIDLRMIYELNNNPENRLCEGGIWTIVNIEEIANLLRQV